WVAASGAGKGDRIDPRTGRLVGRLHVGGLIVRLGASFGSIWVNDDFGRVLRLKPQRCTRAAAPRSGFPSTCADPRVIPEVLSSYRCFDRREQDRRTIEGGVMRRTIGPTIVGVAALVGAAGAIA